MNTKNSKIAEALKELRHNKAISMSLDEYEGMVDTIDLQKKRIEKLRNEKEPLFTFEIRLGTFRDHKMDREYMMHLANQFGLHYHMMHVQLKAEEVSDNTTVKIIQEAVDEKLRQAESFEESAMQMLVGIRKQREAVEEALKRAPWWCRWAIKPKTNEKGS